MTTLQVRIHPRQTAARFYRCGFEFSREPREIEVDAATEARLRAEQMLDVLAEPAPEPAQEPAPEPEPAKTKKSAKK
ncbi:MAG: hypothetical protein LBF61_00880 [Azoarcus sp.]|jgi:hypothetical protein|nr:hypothetical protein [Azoarcus sp.]